MKETFAIEAGREGKRYRENTMKQEKSQRVESLDVGFC